jgi:PAS domain S-box-containing protein
MFSTEVRQQFAAFPADAWRERYGISLAVLLPVLVFALQWHLWYAIQPYAWFLFYPTVFLSVLIGRLRGGILATVISTLLVWFVFIPTEFSFAIQSPWAMLSIIVFLASGIGFSFFYEHLYQAQRLAARKAGDARFQLLFEQAMDGVMIAGAGGCFMEVNSCLCWISGYSRDELLGKNIALLLPEGDLEKIRQLVLNTAERGVRPSAWQLLTKEGKSLPVEVTAYQFADGSWSAIVRDISERHQAIAQERAAEERFHTYMDAIPAVAWMKDADGRYIYYNKAWSKAFGLHHEEYLGKPTSSFMPQAVAAKLTENDAIVLASEEGQEFLEETFDAYGGSRIWNSIKFPIRSGDNPPMIGGVAIEVTEQRKAAKALQDSSELNRAVLDSVRSQLAVLNRQGTIIAVNEAWRNFARENSCTPEQELGTGIGANFLDVCRQGTPSVDCKAGQAGEVIHQAVLDLLHGKSERFACECSCVTSAGCLWFTLNVTPLRIPSGGAVVSYFDITENKRAHEVQRVATAQLKAIAARRLTIQEEERRLLSMELHDHFGQTLTSLQLHLHALHSELTESERGRMIVLEGIANVEELVETSRDLARRLRPPALDDLGLVSAVRWHVNQIARSSSMAIDLQHNLDDKRLAPALELACFRVLQEAISNALRHSLANTLSIALSLELDGLHLSVKDDGIGFNVDETFSKLPQLASLGLLGMRERVAGFGGSLQINASPGRGSEVLAFFPLPP